MEHSRFAQVTAWQDPRLEAQERIMALAGGSLDHVIPGHDPLVLACFPGQNDIARVDLAPRVPIAQTQ